MRRQTRPFTVEVKQKRSVQKRGRSIWGDLDLSAAMAETTRQIEETQQPNGERIDSNAGAVDVGDSHQPQAERSMADPKEAESAEIVTEPPVEVSSPETKKRTRVPRKAKAAPKPPARKSGGNVEVRAEETPATVVPAARKTYTEKERAQKLAEIEKSIQAGGTLKSATREAGISEQTYYHWKKSAVPASRRDDLTDLIALEEENKRLKSLLAERLRRENAELKKRLGLE